jgi:signal transduction histidine kinase
MEPKPRTTVQKMPHSLRLHGFLSLFVRVRFGAAAGALAVIAVSQLVLEVDFPYERLYAAAACILAYNTGFFLYLRMRRPAQSRRALEEETDLRANRAVALLQINLDFAALFSLLHFSGGLENPFVLFFLFHVVIAGILLDGPLAAAEAALAAVLILLLGVLERTGALAHYHPGAILGALELVDNWLFALGLPALMALTIAVLSGFTITLIGRRTRQRDQLIALSLELQAKNDKLEELDSSRRKLLAVATHDLKAPMAAVTGYLEVMRDGYLGPISAAQREVIEKSLKRLARLREFVGDVLSLQAVQHGDLQRIMRPVDVAPLLREAVEGFADAAAAKGVSLALSPSDGLPLIEAAPERLSQVLDNLVSNAVKYTPEGGRVSAVARRADDGVLIEIEDTGIGIAEEDLAHLFEDFFRSSSVKESHEGTGLGLAVSRRIVTAHHGDIWATSKIGGGTVFHVRLPLVQPLHSRLPEERDSRRLLEEVARSLDR